MSLEFLEKVKISDTSDWSSLLLLENIPIFLRMFHEFYLQARDNNGNSLNLFPIYTIFHLGLEHMQHMLVI